MIPLIIVRPEPGATATATRARAEGLEPIICPLFDMVALPWSGPPAEDVDALIFTSANAIRLGGAGLVSYNECAVFAVGDRTAAAAHAAGFARVSVGTSNGAALIERAVAQGYRTFLHLSGQDAMPLSNPVASVNRIPVYHARSIRPPGTLLKIIEQPAVIMVHSPRAAQAVAALCDRRDHLSIVAISAETAAVMGSGWHHISFPDHPRDDAMLELAKQMCK